MISLDDVRRLRDTLDRHGKTYTIKVYPGAPHGWLNDTMPRPLSPRAGGSRLDAAAEGSLRRCSIRATTARGGCRSTNASIPPTTISPRTCGWSNANGARLRGPLLEGRRDPDTIEIYQAYRRNIHVGDNPAVLAIDLYNKAYRAVTVR